MSWMDNLVSELDELSVPATIDSYWPDEYVAVIAGRGELQVDDDSRYGYVVTYWAWDATGGVSECTDVGDTKEFGELSDLVHSLYLQYEN